MANSTVVSNVIKTLGGFTIGVAVTTGLHSFTGTSFLFNTQTEVNDYVTNVQDSMGELSTFLDGNNVVNDEVIQKYKDALKEANSNIDQLIAYYSANESATNEELAQLQAKVNDLQANVDAQVQSQVDEVIAKANAEIDKANTESETTYNNVHAKLEGSDVDGMVQGIKDKNSALTVTDEELQVRDISGIVGGDSSQTPTTPQEPSQTPTTPQEPSVQEPTTTPEKPSETPDMDKSEETPSLYITNVEQAQRYIYHNGRNEETETVFIYTFSDGSEYMVLKSNMQVSEVKTDFHLGYPNFLTVTDPEVQSSEFVTGGYMDLINNY